MEEIYKGKALAIYAQVALFDAEDDDPLCVTMCETTEAEQLLSKVKESSYVSRLKFRIKFQ